MVGKVLTKTGSTVRTWGILHKAAVQSVLLYGRYSMLVARVMLKVLEGFHNQVAGRITGMTARRTTSVEWEWALVDEAL